MSNNAWSYNPNETTNLLTNEIRDWINKSKSTPNLNKSMPRKNAMMHIDEQHKRN